MKDFKLDLEIIGNLITKIIINQGRSSGGHSNEDLVFKFLVQGERVENGCLTWPVLPKIIHKNQKPGNLCLINSDVGFWDEVMEKKLKIATRNNAFSKPGVIILGRPPHSRAREAIRKFLLFLGKNIQRFRRKNRKTGDLEYTFRGSIWYGISPRTSFLHNN